MAGAAEYPPAEFCRKYARLLAPGGVLLSPSCAFAGYKGADAAQVHTKTEKALRVTLKRLVKLSRLCVSCGAAAASTTYGDVTGSCRPCHVTCCDVTCAEHVSSHDTLCCVLRDQLLDQVIECFPSPINLFAHIDFSRAGCPSGDLSWNLWFARQPRLTAALTSAADVTSAWCALTGLKPAPSVTEVRHCLERVTSGLLTLPLTLVHGVHIMAPRQKHADLHLIGADSPEVSMVYNGLCRLLAGSGGRGARLTLVSPDRHVREMAVSATPERPIEAGTCRAAAWAGLYHDFHEKYVESRRLPAPQLCVCIHPGLHTPEGFSTWRPTLELLVANGYATVITTYNEQEFEATLERLREVRAKIVISQANPVGSRHVKQTPHDRQLVWSSNAYFISFKGEQAGVSEGEANEVAK